MDDHTFSEQAGGGTCGNTFEEDRKHFLYAQYMGLDRVVVDLLEEQPGYGFVIKENSRAKDGLKILDIGGGPTSILLKMGNKNLHGYGLGYGLVVDPIDFPKGTRDRYRSHNILVKRDLGENITETGFDEVGIYNCMQHAEDPSKIIENAKKAAPVLRLFEGIDIPAYDGHPHKLTEDQLNKGIGETGSTITCTPQHLKDYGCSGRAYYIVTQ